MACRWSTGPSKKPEICSVCRSTAMSRSAPAVLMRLALARLSASIMMRFSMIHSLIGAVWLWITKASEPRTDSWKRT